MIMDDINRLKDLADRSFRNGQYIYHVGYG